MSSPRKASASFPSFKYYEVEKVEKILKEFEEKYYNPPKDINLQESECGCGDDGGILMTKQELVNFINQHRDKMGIFHIALDERYGGQFTLGYYYDENSSQYKVYEVNERQDIWIRDEFKNESDAINRLYRLIKTKFWIKEPLI